GGPGAAQIRTGHQLAGVEVVVRVHFSLVVLEGIQLFLRQELVLGQANTVLTGNYAVQTTRDLHDAGYGDIGLLQHAVVVRVHGDVGVYVTVTGVHVQRHKHTAFQHTIVNGLQFGQHGCAVGTRENMFQVFAD